MFHQLYFIRSYFQDVDSMSLLCSGSALTGDTEDTAGRVTASCPSSPTETECSSGIFSLYFFLVYFSHVHFFQASPPSAGGVSM